MGSRDEVQVQTISAPSSASSTGRRRPRATPARAPPRARASGSRSGARRLERRPASRPHGSAPGRPRRGSRPGARPVAREQPRRNRRDGGGADLRDRRGVDDRLEVAGLAVVQEHGALVRVEPAGAVPRGDHDLLQREQRATRRRGGRASGRAAARPGGRTTKRSGIAARRARARRGRPPSPSMHDSMSSSSRTSASESTSRLIANSAPSACVLVAHRAGCRAPHGGRELLDVVRAHDDRRQLRDVRSQASASAAIETPRSPPRARTPRVRRRSLGTVALVPSGRSVIREPAGAARRAVLAGQPAAGQWAERGVAEAVLVAQREHRLAVALLEEREGVLHPFVASQPFAGGQLEGLGDLLGRKV